MQSRPHTRSSNSIERRKTESQEDSKEFLLLFSKVQAIAFSLIWLLLGIIVTACRAPEEAGPFSPAGEKAAAGITEELLIGVIEILASDEYEGRGPATAGDKRTRQYLAEQLDAIGYLPAGEDGGWEQPFDIIGINAAVPDQWSFTSGAEELVLQRWDQFIAASGVQNATATIDAAEVVFVGYGIDAAEYDWNDFKDQDLNGKVLLIVNNDPDWDPDLFAGNTRLYYGRWDYKYATAARQGAVGAIIIHTAPSAGYPWQVVQTSWTGEQFELPAADEPRLQVVSWVTEDAAQALVSLAGKNLAELVESAKRSDFQPVPLGVTTSLTFSNALSEVRTANVLGLLPGSDPGLADEVVIYTAHHDHLGIGAPDDTGDTIYNGARDNAAGVAQVLAISNAFQSLPQAPNRSIMMLFVAAEEQGLLGSEYFAANPTFHPGRIAANINYDGGNIWGKSRDVSYIGLGKSSLDGFAETVAERQGRVVKPDLFPDRGMFYRSDQFSFAHIGVPAMYLGKPKDFIGRSPEWGARQIQEYEDVRYHQPSDELYDSWIFAGMVDDAAFGFWVGLMIANAAEMPFWKPGDEFEATRLAAIAELAD
jgi:Zn-dependent M28 family amino/carboxypeptidase